MKSKSANVHKNVTIFGMGYVGLTLAVTMADRGFNVKGIEIRKDVVKMLKKKKPHFHENGLQEKLSKHTGNNLNFLHEVEDNNSSVYIITVGTPLDKNSLVNLKMMENVCNDISKFLKKDDLVILRSTVKIGTTVDVVKKILDKTKISYYLAFCPERTLEGKALEELSTLPQIIGGVDEDSGKKAASIFREITSTIIDVRNSKTAEMIKLVDNASRDVSFAYANEIARLCDVSKISAIEVINSGKIGYPRTNLPMPGPVGGPCLEKDGHILVQSYKELNIFPEITSNARLINERLIPEALESTKKYFKSKKKNNLKKISILGLAFKGIPETDDLRGSTVYQIIKYVNKAFKTAAIFGHDPVIEKKVIRNEVKVKSLNKISQAFTDSDLIIIANNHPAYKELDIEELSKSMNESGIIYDFWNNYNPDNLLLNNNVKYTSIGGSYTL